MMWHVLEHVAGLDGLFTTINKVIKKNGKLIIAVPNSNANEIKKVQVALGSIRRAKTLISLSKK
jgi:2-polyprenyl-3-methyl-5-hydroxy-6-metoxy-1,4-benzoquinol methylase